jgi:hypothetical protein
MPNSRKENERPAWSLGTPSPWLTEITRVARNGQPRAAAAGGRQGARACHSSAVRGKRSLHTKPFERTTWPSGEAGAPGVAPPLRAVGSSVSAARSRAEEKGLRTNAGAAFALKDLPQTLQATPLRLPRPRSAPPREPRARARARPRTEWTRRVPHPVLTGHDRRTCDGCRQTSRSPRPRPPAPRAARCSRGARARPT